LFTRGFVFFRRLLADRDYRVLLLGNVLVGIAYSFVVPFLSMFGTREVGLRPVPFSLFMTATSLGAIACSTVLARWSDARLARRTVLLVGAVAGCLGYLGYAFVRDVTWLTLVGVFVLGLGSVTFSQLFAYARDLFGRDRRNPVVHERVPAVLRAVVDGRAGDRGLGPAFDRFSRVVFGRGVVFGAVRGADRGLRAAHSAE
jgi:MFS family permease